MRQLHFTFFTVISFSFVFEFFQLLHLITNVTIKFALVFEIKLSFVLVEKVFGCRYDNPSANSNTLSNNNNNNNNNHPPPHHHHNPPPPHPNAIQLPPPHPDPTHHPPNPFCASSVSSRNRALVSAGPIGTTGGGVGVHPEELAEGIACGGVGVSELLPSYSDVMLSERLRNSANAANTATSSATVNTATTSNVQTGENNLSCPSPGRGVNAKKRKIM